MYFMRDVPMVNSLNPAFQLTEGRWFVGLPVVSSIHVGGAVSARGLNINQLASNGVPQIRNIVEHFSSMESGYGTLDLNVLNLGFMSTENTYFTLDVTIKGSFEASMPRDLAKVMWYGNLPYAGQTMSFEGLGEKMDLYTSIGIGFSTDIVKDVITIGAKIKYLMGFAYNDMYLTKNSSLYTDPNTWAITAGLAPEMNFAGLPFNLPHGTFDLQDFALESRNYSPSIAGHGAGIDFGIEIKGERFSASGSVINLGAINWKKASYAEAINGGSSITFDGISVDQIPTEENNNDIMGQITDTLISATKMQGGYQYNLLRWTDPTMMFGMSYIMHDHFVANALASLTISRYNTHPLFAVGVSTQGFFVNGTLSYSYVNKGSNLGAGIVMGGTRTKFHLICDNILALDLRSARQTSLRLGLSLLFGDSAETAERKNKTKTMNSILVPSNSKKKSKKPLAPLNPVSQ
ncbi:MAG: DUF5723 family protein [Bacteroidales bacterium]